MLSFQYLQYTTYFQLLGTFLNVISHTVTMLKIYKSIPAAIKQCSEAVSCGQREVMRHKTGQWQGNNLELFLQLNAAFSIDLLPLWLRTALTFFYTRTKRMAIIINHESLGGLQAF